MFQFQNFSFSYEPYPIAVSRPFLDPIVYQALVENFPPIELFTKFPDANKYKYTLAEIHAPETYHRFIRGNAVYRNLYEYLKSKQFVRSVIDCFEANHIELRLRETSVISSTAPLYGGIGAAFDTLRRRVLRPKGLRTRFEFSALPADGGNLQPHTDAPKKIMTLVVSILRPHEWDESWGGGTDVMRPKDPTQNYNFFNRYLAFDAVETLRTIPYAENQCILFLKTFNSLHAVSPIHGPPGALRKTLTINIELD